MIDRTALAIKLNNAATNDPYAVCGKRADPAVSPELFLADSWALVCHECGRAVAPELVDMLADFRDHQPRYPMVETGDLDLSF